MEHKFTPRTATLARKTAETDIALTLVLEGTGLYDGKTGCGFLDHMLALFTRHGRFNLTLACKGDTQVDDHHTVEDIAIVLGQAFRQALGEGVGIVRYGSIALPMDEALLLVAVDLCGRDTLGYALSIPAQKVGAFDTELVEEFWRAFARSLGAAVHVQQLAGTNSHHIIEGAFKALGRALRQAVAIDPLFANEIPSTKGSLL